MRKDGWNKGSGALRVRPHSDNPAIYERKRPEGLSACKKHQQIKDYANVIHEGARFHSKQAAEFGSISCVVQALES